MHLEPETLPCRPQCYAKEVIFSYPSVAYILIGVNILVRPSLVSQSLHNFIYSCFHMVPYSYAPPCPALWTTFPYRRKFLNIPSSTFYGSISYITSQQTQTSPYLILTQISVLVSIFNFLNKFKLQNTSKSSNKRYFFLFQFFWRMET